MAGGVKKAAAVLLVLAAAAAPAYAAAPQKLADGELFVSDRILKDGEVVYRAQDAHGDWEHDAETVLPGLVCAAFIPNGEKQPDDRPLQSIKKLSKAEEKIEAAKKKYAGPEHKDDLVLYAAMNTGEKDGDLAITKVERFGRLLNVTVAVKDPADQQKSGEDIYRESTVFLPLKKLPRFGSLRVRFVDTTGHTLDDLDVVIQP